VRPAKPISLLVLLVASSIALTQCVRTDPEESSANPDAAETQSMQLTEAGRARSTSEEPSDGETADALPAIDPRDSAFAARRLAAAPLYPFDFLIGSLRTSGLSSLDRAARSAGSSFLGTLVRSETIPDDSVMLGSAGLESVIGELISAVGPGTDIRIGRPVDLAAGEYSVPFRFIDNDESFVGELILEMADGEWYISDIQAARLSIDGSAQFVPGGDIPRTSW
jgi:hypothetical protein